MKIFLVLAHPNKVSFNHALFETALHTLKSSGHEIQISDLYAMNFNPVASWKDFTKTQGDSQQYGVMQHQAFLQKQFSSDIQQEQNKLLWCDVVIFQFPLWWFSVPAILKGWFDRVFATGFAFDKDKWFATGLLKPRKAMLSVTTQSQKNTYTIEGMHGSFDQYVKPIHHTLQLTGMTIVNPFVAYAVMSDDESERENYLTRYKEHLQNEFK